VEGQHTSALPEGRLTAGAAVVRRASTVSVLRAAQAVAAASFARTARIVFSRKRSRSQAVARPVRRLATSTAVVLGGITITILRAAQSGVTLFRGRTALSTTANAENCRDKGRCCEEKEGTHTWTVNQILDLPDGALCGWTIPICCMDEKANALVLYESRLSQ
jgi:hypothetical protein